MNMLAMVAFAALVSVHFNDKTGPVKPVNGVAAARGSGGGAVMLANCTEKAIPVKCDLGGAKIIRYALTDRNQTHAWHDGEPSSLPPNSFVAAIVDFAQ